MYMNIRLKVLHFDFFQSLYVEDWNTRLCYNFLPLENQRSNWPLFTCFQISIFRKLDRSFILIFSTEKFKESSIQMIWSFYFELGSHFKFIFCSDQILGRSCWPLYPVYNTLDYSAALDPHFLSFFLFLLCHLPFLVVSGSSLFI